MKTTAALSLALALLLPAAASAAPNAGVMTYSGVLRTPGGTPVAGGTANITFKLYLAATGTTEFWSQNEPSVAIGSDGWFSVVLGSTSPLPDTQFLSQAWLGITVGGEVEMTPRLQVGAAPYALAVDYSSIGGCTAANQILQWNGTAWACIATPGGAGGFTPPACSSGQVMKWNGSAWACAADLDSGLATVSHDASLVGTGAAGSPLGLMSCADNQILQRVAGAWSCTPTPAGGGGVTSVGATLPLASSGGAAPVISLPAASGISSGYVTAADYIAFSGKAPSPGAIACGTSQVLTWTGTAFACVNDQNSGGTVTSVTAAAGSPITVASGTTTPVVGIGAASSTTAGALSSADWTTFSAKQNRVSGACAVGNSIRAINADGTVVCQADTNAGGTVLMKTVSTPSLVFPAATGVTNILRIDVTAPSAGVVTVVASGYCNANTTVVNTQFSIPLGTAPTSNWSFPQPLWRFPNGNPFGQIPFSNTEDFPAVAGLNSYYLNFSQDTALTIATSCGARATAYFTPTQLP
jgi:hypothetical protein